MAKPSDPSSLQIIAHERSKEHKLQEIAFQHERQRTYSCQFVDYALLFQHLELEKRYFLVIVCLVQVIQRLELLQRRMGANLLLLRRCNTHRQVFRDDDNNHLLKKKKKRKTKQEKMHFADCVLTMSRFSLARFFSFSSSFWIVWVKSSFLLLSSLFLSSRGLHCFSDSRTRLSWSREAIQRVMFSWCARDIRLRQNRRGRDER